MNIIKSLQKEIEKGNTLINKSTGAVLNTDKIKENIKKDYIKALKDGSLSFEVSFEEFTTATIDSDYLTVTSVLSMFYAPITEESAQVDGEMNEPEIEETPEII